MTSPGATRGRAVRRAVVALVAIAVLAALGAGTFATARTPQGPVLADRSWATVRAEEARITALLRHGEPAVAISPSDCRVRLMRQSGSTSWVWTLCHVMGSQVGETWSGPVRVDADTLWVPDQPGYANGIRERFPADLVDLALSGSDRFLAELGVRVPSS